MPKLRWVVLTLFAVTLIGGLGVFVAAGGWRAAFYPSSLFYRTFLSPTGAVLAGAFVGCSLLLAILATLLWRIGRSFRIAGADDIGRCGSVALEFAMVFPIALVIFLMMLQSALLMSGLLCTNYASFCAARTAVSVLQRTTATEDRNRVDAYTSSPTSEKSAKVNSMRSAAIWAVLPVSSASSKYASASNSGVIEGALSNFFSQYDKDVPAWIAKSMGRRLTYATDHTQLVLTEPDDGVQYAANEDITVEVKHDFYLAIPYADKVFAGVIKIGSSGALSGATDLSEGGYAITIRSTCTLPNEGTRTYIGGEMYPSLRTTTSRD